MKDPLIPPEIQRLAEERESARKAKDFEAADRLRDRIRRAGYEVADVPGGPEISPRSVEQAGLHSVLPRKSEQVESVLGRPPTWEASIQWVLQGWPEDVHRSLDAFRRFHPGIRLQFVVVETTREAEPWPAEVDVVRMAPGTGWAAARNAGIRRALGRTVVLIDGSIEAAGDVLGPLLSTLGEDLVGITGPFGLATNDLREFREAEGPNVDAVESYLMAFRRGLAERGLRFDEKFSFYRMADVELSFQIKALGLRARVTEAPVIRHGHRVWENTTPERRDQLSKRNFYRFLDRWRGRLDLTEAGGFQPGGVRT